MISDPVVLYVENDANSRIIIQMMLTKRMGISTVYIFEDSVDFVPRVKALPVPLDIVLLDIHVKPHNGFEMLAMLRELETLRAVPIVALTASVMNEEITMLQTSGFDGCIAKPLNALTFPDLFTRSLHGEHIWNVS